MNYYSFFPILSQFLQKEIQRTQKDKLRTSKETNNRHPSIRKFSPTEEIQKFKEILEISKLYHNPKKDTLNTIADIVNTLEQARDLMQNFAIDTTRVSRSAYAHP